MSDSRIAQKKSKNDSLQRDYVSDLDLFLQEFDKKEEAYSVSRRAEEVEYRKIGQLRDNPNNPNQRNSDNK